MPYSTNQELPEQVKALPKEAQTIFRKTFNASIPEYGEERAFKIAWSAVKKSYKKVGDKWVKKQVNMSTLYQVELSTESEQKTDDTFRQQVLKLGRWTKRTAKGGVWELTKEKLQKIIDNFRKKYYGKKVPVTLGHPFPVDSAGQNAGEVIDLIATDDGADAIYKVNKDIAPKIKSKEIEEVSPTINEDLFSPDLDKSVGPAITGLALVNGPFQKDMREAVALSNQDYNIVQLSLEGDNTMEKEEKEETKTETKETETEEKEAKEETEETEETKETKEAEEKSSTEDKKATESEDKSSDKEEKATSQESKESTLEPKTKEQLREALEAERDKNKDLVQANKRAEAKGKIKELVSKGKIAPAEEQVALSIAQIDDEVVNLSNDKNEKLGDMFLDFIGKRQPIVELSTEVGAVDAGGQLGIKPSETEKTFVESMMQSYGHITDEKERKRLEDEARKKFRDSQKTVKQFRKKE